MPQQHDLKCWPEPFEAIIMGHKTHEVRVNDRRYAVGDVLWLHEYNPNTMEYTGRKTRVAVTYITDGGQWGLPDHLCVMSVRPT